MSGLVRICLGKKLPHEGEVREMHAGGRQFCVAMVDGEISVLDNLCPHKGGPLGQGFVEHGRVLCPWHDWSFDLKTGEQHKGKAQVRVYDVDVEDGELFVRLS
ncbi:Rieske (2Fe-2S) protein [Acidicapsa ligni]|uniref:Rieske (2Fe-2S) protein n=1 Tax=Acidicapsa ligni TaxID=542300 RepID=UPI0021E0F2C7|nr:Rieske (2Fe-2S) protein [Acidicapsa ligni]